jgi:hypothetical protein
VGEITRFLALPDAKSEVAGGFVETSEAGDLNRQKYKDKERHAIRTNIFGGRAGFGRASHFELGR